MRELIRQTYKDFSVLSFRCKRNFFLPLSEILEDIIEKPSQILSAHVAQLSYRLEISTRCSQYYGM